MKSIFLKLLIIFIALILIIGFSIFLFYLKFPKSYFNEIKIFSEKYNLDTKLVQSVIKAESDFNKDAISSSGAIGLMQLLPSTAKEIAEKLEIKNFNENYLFLPEVNIEFGCYYLRYLLNYYNNNQTNALSAYNAGLSNVNNWLNDKNYSSDKKTLTNIPFKETKNYIKKIKLNFKFYNILYK